MDESVKAIYDDLLKKSKAELRGLIGQLESTDAYENLYTNLWKKFTRKEATLKDKENLLKALAQAIYDYKPLEEEDNYESPTAEELEELKRKAKEEIERLKPKPKPRSPSPKPQPPKPRAPSPPKPQPRSKSPTYDCDSWIMKTNKKAGDVDFADIVFVCGQKELSFEKFTKSVLNKDKVSPYINGKGDEMRSVMITRDESIKKAYWLIYSIKEKTLKFVLNGKDGREKLDNIPKFLSDYLKNNNLCPIKKVDGKFTFLGQVEVLPKTPVRSPKKPKEEPTEEEKKEEKRNKRVADYLTLLSKKDITACDDDNPCADDKDMCDVESKKCMKKSFAKYEPYGKDTKVFEHNGHTYIGKKETIDALEATLKAKKPEPESEDEPEDDDDVDVDLNLDDDIDLENLTALQKELFDCLMKGGSP